ncbi:Protein F26A1.8 [Aphelenchoides bicaudatus]|nr:Protein F26A1.8 [Aphelenchoides bicaudatus]
MKELEIVENLQMPLDPLNFNPDENQNEVKEEKISIEDETGNVQVVQRRRTPSEWFRKYFLEGQTLENQHDQLYLPVNQSKLDEEKEKKQRKTIAILLPLLVSQILWWSAAIKYDYLSLYKTYWQMPAAMIIGSTIAGMTSEAGGAVAFPVMTFALKALPRDGRDFSLLIQSFGMGMAMFTIVYNRIQVEWKAISYAVTGSVPGMIVGFHFVDPFLSPAQKKMIFVSVWTSFAIALWILNREHKRRTVPVILDFCAWKGAVLLATGFAGGIFTAFAGSGTDICVFAVVTLLFSVTEKVATPTTIISMALCSWFSLYWRVMIANEPQPISDLVWNFIKCSIPVCTIMAPAWKLARITLSSTALFGFLCTRPALPLIFASLAILLTSFPFFTWMSRQGKTLLNRNLRKLQLSGQLRRMSVVDYE